jgi:hypothetical protein
MMGERGFGFYTEHVNKDEEVSYIYMDGSFTIAGDDFIVEITSDDRQKKLGIYQITIKRPMIVNFEIVIEEMTFGYQRKEIDFDRVWNSEKAKFLFSQNEG